MVSKHVSSGPDDIIGLRDPLGDAFRARVLTDLDPFSIVRGEERPDQLVAERAEGAAEPEDVVWTTEVGPILLSNNALSVLTTAKVSGWSTIPCAIAAGSKTWIFNFLTVSGRGAAIDHSAGTSLGRIGSMEKRQGIHFERDDFGSCDIFLARSDYRRVFVRKSVKAAFDHAGIGNVAWLPLSEIEYFARV